MKAISFSIISGILSSIVIWAGLSIYKHEILPSLTEHNRETVEVAGKWKVSYSEKFVSEAGEAELTQSGNTVSGNLVTSISRHGITEKIEYEVSGIISGQIISVHFKTKGRQGTFLGAAVLEISPHGKEMSGLSVYRSPRSNKIEPYATSLKRSL